MESEALMSTFLRRGVLWPTAEIYGGIQGLYDYGEAGSSIKRNLEAAWERWFVGLSPGYYRIEPAEILPEAVVRASGHLANFADPLVKCNACGEEYRADTLLEARGVQDAEALRGEELQKRLVELKIRCPRCGKAEFTPPKAFNLMFGFDWGAQSEERAYLRPETAQSSYLAFPRMWNAMRKKLPLGVAVVGKAYRNEIAPRQVLFRMRAFTQAELQIFFDPEGLPENWKVPPDFSVPALTARDREKGAKEATLQKLSDLVAQGQMPEFYAYHLMQTYRCYRDVLGYPEARLRLFEKNEKERAFYNRIQYDFEAHLDSLGGFKELGAVHYRGDYDLTKHSEGSKTDLGVTLENGRHILPHVLELTFGVDRNLWALADLLMKKDGDRTVWSLPPYLAPKLAGILPLIPKEHGEDALRLHRRLVAEGFHVVLDDSGSIGRRYARLDEIGTPFAITVDRDSLTNQTYTLRERDSKAQRRVTVEELAVALRKASLFPTPHSEVRN